MQAETQKVNGITALQIHTGPLTIQTALNGIVNSTNLITVRNIITPRIEPDKAKITLNAVAFQGLFLVRNGLLLAVC